MSTIPNLTEATATAFTIRNVRTGFVANGQIDPLSNSVPSLLNMLHTYRGNIKGTCLADGEGLVRKFFEEVHTNGCISEEFFTLNGIPKDCNSRGVVVERPNSIQLKNCHRAKVLSSPVQIRERRHLLDTKRMKEFRSKEKCFNIEDKEYEMNSQCECKFVAILHSVANGVPYNNDLVESLKDVAYDTVSNGLTVDVLSHHKEKVYKDEFRAFLRVRAARSICGDRINFSNVLSKNKEVLIDRCVECRLVPIKTRLIEQRPTPPVLLEPNLIHTM